LLENHRSLEICANVTTSRDFAVSLAGADIHTTGNYALSRSLVHEVLKTVESVLYLNFAIV
jgi:hypothetical protein